MFFKFFKLESEIVPGYFISHNQYGRRLLQGNVDASFLESNVLASAIEEDPMDKEVDETLLKKNVQNMTGYFKEFANHFLEKINYEREKLKAKYYFIKILCCQNH